MSTTNSTLVGSNTVDATGILAGTSYVNAVRSVPYVRVLGAKKPSIEYTKVAGHWTRSGIVATYTTNYNLKKYNPADRVDATAQNGNLDAIDAAIKAVFDAPAFDEEDDFHDTVGLYAYTQVPTATYTKKYAHYWRKGDLIYFTIALSGNISVAGVNGACISGLPFNVDANHIRDFSMSISILTGV